LFKGFVSTNRPGLDIDTVATGETWFGPDALKRNLVDELVTSDDVLTRHVADGYDVFSVKYAPKPASPLARFSGGSDEGVGWRGVLLGLIARAMMPAGAAAPLGGVAADELTRQALEGRQRGAEARWAEEGAPRVRAEGLGGGADQPSWGWDDDFE
jgi:ClpP class serine protease